MRYPSIDNHYLTKNLKYKKELFKDKMEETIWCVEEKVHGANISFEFAPNTPVKFFSRNQEIIGDEFYNCWDDLKKYEKILQPVQTFVDKFEYKIRLFSEYCGPGIQKGIDYGSERKFIFFDMMMFDQFVSRETLKNLFKSLYLSEYTSHILSVFQTLDEAFEFNTVINSTHSNKEDNIIEGVVIKPLNTALLDQHGSPCYFKIKNKKFMERKPKKNIIKVTYSDDVNDKHNIFMSYITKARMDNIFSKEGCIEDVSELGKYITLIREDAIEEFNKENEYDKTKYDKKEDAFIFNCAKPLVELLKGEL